MDTGLPNRFSDRIISLLDSVNPKEQNKCIINTVTIATPLGSMYACATEQGICMLEFTDHKNLVQDFTALLKLMNATIVPGPNKHFEKLHTELNEYFKGERKIFTIPLCPPGTSFQQKVWNELLKIPYGSTRSYTEQASAIGNLAAIRAVAQANGVNRIPIIIPCHRVIGSNGKLTGYGSGLHRKRWLLELEKENSTVDLKTTLF